MGLLNRSVYQHTEHFPSRRQRIHVTEDGGFPRQEAGAEKGRQRNYNKPFKPLCPTDYQVHWSATLLPSLPRWYRGHGVLRWHQPDHSIR